MSEWKYLDSIEKLSSSVHCDTRDFHVICGDESMDGVDKFIRNNPIKHCLFYEEEIIPLLKSLEIASGGKGEWRQLVLDSIDQWWLKYIRFQKLEDGQYFCFTTSGDIIIPLPKDKLKAEFVEKKCYCH